MNDADIEQLLKEAVDIESTKEREGLRYRPNESEPYSGWAKIVDDSGQVRVLGQLKDGKLVGLWTKWHENGQKRSEGTYKDGGQVSAKYWNSKGEEVETAEEASK